MILKCILILFAAIASADPVVIQLDQPYLLQSVEGGWRPPDSSQVTYIIDGLELRPDHHIYDHATGEPLHRTWSLITPDVQQNHQKFEQMAQENGSPVVVHVQSGDVVIADFPNINTKLEISDPGFRKMVHEGALLSPNPNAATFTLGNTEFRPNGKVYVDGKPTGEMWGVPAGAVVGPVTSMPGGINETIKGVVKEFEAAGFGHHTVVAVQKYFSDQKEWDKYIEQKSAKVQLQMQNAINFDKVQAEHLSNIADQVAIDAKIAHEDFTSWVASKGAYFNKPSPSGMIPKPTLNDVNDIHVKYDYGEKTHENIKIQISKAIKDKNFGKLSSLLDVTLNSPKGVPTELKKYTKEGKILLPEKLDPTLPPSPLANIPITWNQDSQLGQVATRTINRLQAQWGVQNGLKGAEYGKVMSYLISISWVRKAIEILPERPFDTLAILKFTNFVLDTTVGVGMGIGEGAVDLVRSVPELITFAGKMGKAGMEIAHDPEKSIEMVHHLIEAIPEIRHAMYTALNKNLNLLTGKDNYERGRILGKIAFEIIGAYATGGIKNIDKLGDASKLMNTPMMDSLKNVKDVALGIKKSPKFLDQMIAAQPKIQHWVDHATDVKFHAPGVSKNPFPLEDAWVANTFSGSTFMSYKTKKAMELFRVYEKDEWQIGRFFTDAPTKGTSAMIDLALIKDTHNTATKWVKVEVPAGIRIFEGNASTMHIIDSTDGKFVPAEFFIGGGRQYFINKEDLSKLKVIHYGDI